MLLLIYTLLILLVPLVLVIVAIKYFDLGKNISEKSTSNKYIFKNPSADLRTYRFLFLSLGLLLAVGLSSFVINYDFKKDIEIEKQLKTSAIENSEPIFEAMVIPRQKQPEQTPPEELDQVEEVEEEEIVEEVVEEVIQDLPTMDLDVPEVDIDSLLADAAPTESKMGPVDNKIYDFVEQEAGFPGGESARQEFIQNYIANKLKRYNKKLLRKGDVYVSFVIEKDGSISNVSLMGPGVPNSYQNDLAKEAISSMPKWAPAKNNGFAVRQRFRMPIKY